MKYFRKHYKNKRNTQNGNYKIKPLKTFGTININSSTGLFPPTIFTLSSQFPQYIPHNKCTEPSANLPLLNCAFQSGPFAWIMTQRVAFDTHSEGRLFINTVHVRVRAVIMTNTIHDTDC